MSADALLVDTVERLLGALSTHEAIEDAEKDGWSAPIWSAMAEAGFPWVGVDEAAGGSGGTVYDGAAVLRAVGAHAAPVPVAETMVGGWLLGTAGRAVPEGPTAVVEPGGATVDGDRLRIDAVVAWARHADRLLATSVGTLFVLRPDQVAITPGANLAGESRDHVTADLAIADVEQATAAADDEDVRRRGALTRVVMAAGALSAMAQMTVDYTNERRQFGKPVATFQAVQQHLVVATQSAVRAQMAADIAVRALDRGAVGNEIAAARVVVDDAIGLGTRAAHQAHGAMGVTREYPLHQLTRRLWSWRHEWGTTTHWRRQLGRQLIATGADDLFATLTAS
jgi:acyl-CoA dehydrogenase